MKSVDSSRIVRLTQIQHLLHRHREGLTTKELAALCGASVRTIQRDLLVLQSDLHVPVERRSFDRYVILRDYLLPPAAFSLYETLILFLAMRLMVRQTDEENPHVNSAIAKLVSIMPAPAAIQLRQSLHRLAQKPANRQEIEIFEKACLAWVTQRRLRMVYLSLHGRQKNEWLVEPYFIEMTGVGYSMYLIGRAESGERAGIYTFKLNRIQELEVLDENYRPPEGLKMDDLLGSAWGVIYGEEVPVKLKFSPSVARRVKETVWHHSQQIEDTPDGGCLLTFHVGSTLEITPWIRSWGPDVEVLEPLELREQMKEWAKQLGEIYS